MVIGNGMIAKEFNSYQANDAYIIFASGVSNSTHSAATAFEREKKLLTNVIENAAGKSLVYFSTCSMYDASMKGSAYVQHKQNMEAIIIQQQPLYNIFRLSNPIGNTGNTNTVINFFIKHIIERQPFSIWQHAARNIIDIDDMYNVCDEILQKKLFKNSIVNIANPNNYPISFIVETMETHFGIKAVYTVVDKGDSPHINVSAIEPLFKKFKINFNRDYLPNLLQKYFPQ